MKQPSPPTSLPKYLAEGLPKQDTETLHEIQNYIEALIEYRDQPHTDELPETAEPVDESDSAESGTVVKEKVSCGDDSCKCASGDLADLHGPYLYRYYRANGTTKSEYIGKPQRAIESVTVQSRFITNGRIRRSNVREEDYE